MTPIYKRVLLKLSGEGLMGDKPFGVDERVLDEFTESIKKVYDNGISLCVVIGGGNFYRGVNNTNKILFKSGNTYQISSENIDNVSYETLHVVSN